MIFGWITSKLAGPIIGGVLLVVSLIAVMDGARQRAIISQLRFDRTELSKMLERTSTNLGTCQANFRAVELALDRQGADIRDLASKSATATAEAQRRLAEIARQTTAAREASQRVLALPRPAPDMACEAAAKLLRGPM